jgi:hypothetical protein
MTKQVADQYDRGGSWIRSPRFEPMLSDLERSLLLHYTEYERIIGRHARSHQHIRLLALGYIQERLIDPAICWWLSHAPGMPRLVMDPAQPDHAADKDIDYQEEKRESRRSHRPSGGSGTLRRTSGLA